MGGAVSGHGASRRSDRRVGANGLVHKVFLLSLRRALELDPSFEDGFYERPPIRGLRAFASIYAGWGVSEAFYRTGAYSAFAAKDHEEFVQYFWEPFFQRCDANNLLSQLWTWEQGNISDNPLYKGDFEAALKAIKARTIILPVDTDRYFPPVDAEYEAQHIPNGACRVLKRHGATWRRLIWPMSQGSTRPWPNCSMGESRRSTL